MTSFPGTDTSLVIHLDILFAGECVYGTCAKEVFSPKAAAECVVLHVSVYHTKLYTVTPTFCLHRGKAAVAT